MRLTPSICIAVSMTCCAIVPTQAAKIKYHHAPVVIRDEVAPHRVCDWIGPGGRAVYRCRIESQQPSLVSQNDPPAERTCSWLAAGGPPRGIYTCR